MANVTQDGVLSVPAAGSLAMCTHLEQGQQLFCHGDGQS